MRSQFCQQKPHGVLIFDRITLLSEKQNQDLEIKANYQYLVSENLCFNTVSLHRQRKKRFKQEVYMSRI